MPVEHPRWGPYRRHGPLLQFDRIAPDLNPPPLAGQHNAEVLAGLGVEPDAIEHLTADGVLWQEDG